MTVISLLASSQGQNGEILNIALAHEIVKENNKVAVKELIDGLNSKDKNIQSDCIKTLYEIGYVKPDLISEYYRDFIMLIGSKNNRLVWGGMIAISTITPIKHKEIFAALDKIIEVVAKGSVITIDCGVVILSGLNRFNNYTDKTEPLLTDILWNCPIKQLPMYIEKSLVSISKTNKEIYQTIIDKRKAECDKESQLKRLEKLTKQIIKI